jgi:hypothetical protein
MKKIVFGCLIGGVITSIVICFFISSLLKGCGNGISYLMDATTHFAFHEPMDNGTDKIGGTSNDFSGVGAFFRFSDSTHLKNKFLISPIIKIDSKTGFSKANKLQLDSIIFFMNKHDSISYYIEVYNFPCSLDTIDKSKVSYFLNTKLYEKIAKNVEFTWDFSVAFSNECPFVLDSIKKNETKICDKFFLILKSNDRILK